MVGRRAPLRAVSFAWLGLMACAPQPGEGRIEEPASAPTLVVTEPDSPGREGALDSSALTLQPSGETIYVWGGVYPDATLDAPVPLSAGVVGPGDPLDFVRVRCLIRGPQDKAKVKCRAAGRAASPAISQSWHERLHACAEVHERAPTRAELKTVQATWETIVAGPDFRTKGMAWTAVRHIPPPLSGKPAVLEVAIIHEWKGPEHVAGGCENAPPDQGCDPVVVETGRTITLTRDTVRYGYSRAPGVELRQLFGGRAPLLHRIRIGTANVQGFVEEHSSLKVEGSSDGIEDYRRRQLAALDGFAAAGNHRPDVLAAIHVNKAIVALHLKDLSLLEAEVGALRQLLASAEVDRVGLKLDGTLAYFDRVLAKQWLLDDPCV